MPSLPVPNTSIQLTPLLSTPPPESKTIYEVYLNQIGMIVLTGFGPRPDPPLAPEQSFGRGTRPVVVGLALKPDFSTSGADANRMAFGGVMEMVMECRVW